MKKVLIIVAVVIAIAAAGIGFYFYQNNLNKLTIEEILPQGALAYVRFSDIEKRWTEFKSAKLWRNIRAIDIPMLMEKSGLTPKEIEASGYPTLKKIISDPNTSMLFMKFFGREAALGLYPLEIKEFKPDNWKDVASSLVMVVRLSPDMQVAETMSSLMKELDPAVQLTTEEYKKHKITLIEIPKNKIKVGYVRIKDLLVVGFSDQAVKMCVDVVSKEKASLRDDPAFKRVQAKYLPSARTAAYANLELIISDIKKLLLLSIDKETKKEDSAQFKQEIDRAMAQMAGFTALGYSAITASVETSKFDLIYDKDQLDPQVKKMYACAPQENKTIRFIPQNVLGYQWSNCFDIRTQWETIQKELNSRKPEDAKGPSSQETIAALEKNLKLSIEGDLLLAFGAETGGYLSDITLTGVFPFPKLLLFVKIADRPAAQRVLAAVASRPEIVWQKENYKDVQIQYTALPLGEDFLPGYCFLNDYLLLATSRQALKESIDAFNAPGASLDSSAVFKNVNVGLTDKNNSVFFLKSDDLLDRVHRMIEWQLRQAKARAAQQQAFKEGMEQRLEDSKGDLEKEEGELKDLEENLRSTNDQLKSLQSQGMDVAEILTKIDHSEKQIEAKKESIQKLKDSQTDIEDAIQSFKEEKANPEMLELYVHQVVFPILDGLSSYKAIGSKAIFTDEGIESTMYIKKEE